MTDIAPELIEGIKNTYTELIGKSDTYKRLIEKKAAEKATYTEAHKLAVELGDELTKAYKLKLSSSVLPDGKMYYNIAERLVNQTLNLPQETLTGYCIGVQEALNEAAGIGMEAAIPEVNADRIAGIVQRLADAESFDDIDWILDDPIKNLLQAAVDDFVKANAQRQYDAGLHPKIVRTLSGGCCKWCRDLAGTYDYPVENEDVYRRHENCRCTVTFIPTNGGRQDVWTKRIRYSSGLEISQKEYNKDKKGFDNAYLKGKI